MSERAYRGKDIEVTFDLKRCIHAAECVKGLPGVFDVDKKPWIQPDEASADEVAEVVGRCPTGALKFKRLDGGSEEGAPKENVFQLIENGPLYVRGAIEVKRFQSEDTLLQDQRVAFCRCGASKNKPFCDNAHKDANFSDAGLFESDAAENQDSSSDASLQVTIMPGPLMASGPFCIQDAQQRVRFRGKKAALCRCGASKNKPFCDGTHKDIGFKDD